MRVYIDRDKIKITCLTFTDIDGEVLVPLSAVKQAIAQTPAEDVAEVVLCQDCKRSRPMIFDGYCYCKRNRVVRKSDDFCSRGKRKEQS